MMKIRTLQLLTCLCLFAGGVARATVVVWTNTAGGMWNNMNNWLSNQVPVAGDDVVITNVGTYTVTNSSSSVTLDSLTLGGSSGIQTLTGAATLTLTNASMVGANGVFNMSGGDLEGSLTVAQGGILTMSNNIYFSQFNSSTRSNTATLTNFGTVICGGTLYGNGNSAGAGGGMILNAGLWQAQAPSALLSQVSPSNTFINTGTLEQLNGSANATINWYFRSTGTITTTGGTFTLNWLGPSTVQGFVNLASSTISAPLTLASNAVLNLGGGDLEGSITVLQGATLSISNVLYFAQNNTLAANNNTASLTNYGTVICATTIEGSGNATNRTVGGIIDNAGLWQALSPIQISTYFYAGINTFINTGTLEQSSAGTSTIGWAFYNNGGTVSTPSGAFDMTNWLGSGVIYGSPLLSGGTISGTLAAGDLITFSAGVNGALTVSSNAQANWNGGDLEGSITVLQGGMLTISNSVNVAQANGSSRSNTATLTNYGTVIWAGTIYGYGNNAGAGGGLFVNAGLWDVVTASSLANQGSPSNTFINSGTLEQTGGSGIVNNAWTFYNNGGTLTTAGGSFNMGNWLGSGVVNATAVISGGTVSGTLAPGSLMTFSSTTINGPFTVSSNAQANWNGGDLEGSVTIMQGGTLTISNTLYFSQNNNNSRSNTATMTNYGTAIWAGNIYGNGNNAGSGGGTILNAGLWDAVVDNSMANQSSPSNTFINTGTLEKTGGTSGSTISWNFISTGTITTISGPFALNFSGPSVLNGTLNLSQASITNPFVIASNAVLNLLGGDLESSITVLQGGILTISNTFYFSENNNPSRSNIASVTNFGTVFWAGTIYGYGNGSGAGGGLIYNAGVWDAVAASTLANQSNPSNFFINTGTLEQTGGTGTSTLNWNFNSTGTIATPVGVFGLNWFGPSTVHGNFTLASGTIAVPLTLASNAVMNLAGGDLEGSPTVLQGGTLTISNTLYFAEDNYTTAASNGIATLTNFGTVRWGGSINGSGNSTNHAVGGIIYNAGFWESVAANQMSTYVYAGTNTFVNTGTVEQTGGTGTTTINWNFLNNGGVLGSQTNTLSLSGAYNLAGGTLNFGINNSTHYGIITLAGNPAAVAGTLTANFNNGYVPATGSTFPVLTYTSENGTFTNVNLPFAVAWQTNFGSSAFTLSVLNVRPTLAALANQTVDELTPLTVFPNATDPDAGQTLTFSLASAPQGMTILPGSGIISWTPSQTESPSTNTVLVSVTDNGNPALSATNSFQVVVVEVNAAPVLPAISHVSVNEQSLLTLTNTAAESDIHAAITGYGLINPPTGMIIGASGIITWTPFPTQSPGVYFITTVVTNLDAYDLVNPSLTASNTIAVVVYEVNATPIFPAPAEQTVNEQTLLTVTNAATAPNIHATLSYSLIGAPTNMSINGSGVITWTPSKTQSPSTNTITTVATANDPLDMVNPQLSASNTFTIVVTEVNVAPVLPVLPTQTVHVLTLLTVTNTAAEANIHATHLAYGLVGAPTSMNIDSNGIITWTPAPAQSPSTNLITTVVTNTDAFDSVSPHLTATNTFTVIVNEANLAPTLPAVPPQTVNEMALLIVTNTVTAAAPHASLSYALVAPPAGAVIDTNGIFTWTPGQNQGPGTNTITVVALSADPADAQNPLLASLGSFTVIVYAPTLVPIASQTVNVGQVISFNATGSDNDPTRTVTYSVAGAPAGATINPTNGVFNWRPGVVNANTTNTVTVELAANSIPPATASQTFKITVNALAPVNLGMLTATGGQAQIQVSGPVGPDYILQTSTVLAPNSWASLLTNTPASSPFSLTDTNAAAFRERFYRVQIGP